MEPRKTVLLYKPVVFMVHICIQSGTHLLWKPFCAQLTGHGMPHSTQDTGSQKTPKQLDVMYLIHTTPNERKDVQS